MTMAKGIANGFPIAATLATAAIADSWKGGNISTFGGNPISRDRGQRDHRHRSSTRSSPRTPPSMGKILRDGLEALQKKYPRAIGDVRGQGPDAGASSS